MSDPIKAIARRIARRCDGLVTSLLQRQSSPWRTVVFDGERHRFQLSIEGETIEEALLAIQDEIATDLPIPGHLLSEISVHRIDRAPMAAFVTLDATTIRLEKA